MSIVDDLSDHIIDSISESEEFNSNSSMDDFSAKEDVFINKNTMEMSVEEQQRYEIFRRSNFLKGTVKKFISHIIGQAVNPNIIIAVSGLSKVFVGELVTEAKKVQIENEQSGALQPSHIHEAMRRLNRKMPNTKIFKKPYWN